MALLNSNQISGIEGGIGLGGLGLSILGTLEQSSAAKAKAQEEKQIAALEMQADQQRRQAMEISARRQQLQTVRTAQQARAMALSTAVGQGSQFSSSAESGQAQTNAQAAYSNLGVSQNLQIGEKLFDINAQIDSAKMAEADAESKMSSGLGLAGLGKGLLSSSMDIGKLMSLI